MRLPTELAQIKIKIDECHVAQRQALLVVWYDAVKEWLLDVDPRFAWIERSLKIKDKETGQIVPFSVNIPQLIVYMHIRDMEELGIPVRIIVLKARQMGISTLIEAILFYSSSNIQGYSSFIVAHTAKGSDHIFRMSKLFLKYLEGSPSTDYSNRKEILFSTPLDSEITIDVANKNRSSDDEIGRTKTVHGFHASEVSSWDSPEGAMMAVMNTMPSTKNTIAVMESTARGASGYFHDTYWKSKQKLNDFRAIFLGWNLDPRNSMESAGELDLTEKEMYIKEKHGLDGSQLSWRRWAIANKHDGDERSFEQENPITDDEAFKTSGAGIFSKEALDYYFRRTEKGIKGILEKVGMSLRFTLNSRGYVTLFDDPVPNKRYVIGADVAEGLPKGDFSCAYVMDIDNCNVCAVWHGHIDPDLFGEELSKLGEFYNYAYIGVENNNHGLTTLVNLKDRYFFLHTEWIEDKLFDTLTEKLGWHTNLKTKRIMVDDAVAWMRDCIGEMHDEFLLKECTTFVRNDKGHAAAEGTATDDRVIAWMITIQMYKRCPFGANVESYERPAPVETSAITVS